MHFFSPVIPVTFHKSYVLLHTIKHKLSEWLQQKCLFLLNMGPELEKKNKMTKISWCKHTDAPMHTHCILSPEALTAIWSPCFLSVIVLSRSGHTGPLTSDHLLKQ